MQLFAELRSRNVRVRILTNSLVYSDVLLAHSGYMGYRIPLSTSCRWTASCECEGNRMTKPARPQNCPRVVYRTRGLGPGGVTSEPLLGWTTLRDGVD